MIVIKDKGRSRDRTAVSRDSRREERVIVRFVLLIVAALVVRILSSA